MYCMYVVFITRLAKFAAKYTYARYAQDVHTILNHIHAIHTQTYTYEVKCTGIHRHTYTNISVGRFFYIYIYQCREVFFERQWLQQVTSLRRATEAELGSPS
jgi:hypothetical protein